MIPLYDSDIVRRGTPFVTIGFIAASVLVFVYQLSLDDLGTFVFTRRFGAIPSELLGGAQIETVLVMSLPKIFEPGYPRTLSHPERR